MAKKKPPSVAKKMETMPSPKDSDSEVCHMTTTNISKTGGRNQTS